MTANVKHTVEQRRVVRNTAYQLALIHSTSSSNRQSKLEATQVY